MRLATWILILSVLNFGIGWVSASIAGGEGDIDSAVRQDGASERRGGSRFSRSRGGRGGRGNPFVDEVRCLSDELKLDEQDHLALEAVVDDVRAQVGELEKQIFTLVRGSEARVLDILSDEQQSLLQDLRVARVAEYYQGRRERARDFFAEQVDAVALESVMAVLEQSDGHKMEHFRTANPRGRDPHEFRTGLQELSDERDSRLVELVGEEVFARYEESKESPWGRERESSGPSTREGSGRDADSQDAESRRHGLAPGFDRGGRGPGDWDRGGGPSRADRQKRSPGTPPASSEQEASQGGGRRTRE